VRVVSLCIVLAVAFAVASPAVADPGIGVAPGGPSLLAPGDILEPGPGAPTAPPLPAPAAVVPGGALGLPPAGNADDISYGDFVFPPLGPFFAQFSVAPGALGHPFSVPFPPHTSVFFEGPAGPPGGDWAVEGDIYSSYNPPGGMLGPFGPVFPPAPCAIATNLQSADENGMPPFAFGFPMVGLGLIDVAPGPPPGAIDDLDSLELLDNAFVDGLPPPGMLDGPVFFTVDGATAGMLPPLPPFFTPNTAGDVLAFDPAVGLVKYATFAMLGLAPGDDIDALEVSYTSGAAIPAGWAPGPDVILFSLAPGSPTNAALGSICFGPGSGLPGDIYVDMAPFGAPPMPALDTEMLGLNTGRSGGFAGADDVDAIDFTLASFIDTDGDVQDDAVDFDDDGDLIGDMIDNCPLAANPMQENTDAAPLDNGPVVSGDDVTIVNGGDAAGDACDFDIDNDGLGNADELGLPGPACPAATAPTDPFDIDTDEGHRHDGWECANGTDPNDPSLEFAGAATPDADGDNISGLWEERGYNASDALTDSDGDGCWDMVELGSVDGNLTVGDVDRLVVARRALGLIAPEPSQDYVLDIDKNGVVGNPDRLFVARAALLGAPWTPKSC
jgi:hypothetical protein